MIKSQNTLKVYRGHNYKEYKLQLTDRFFSFSYMLVKLIVNRSFPERNNYQLCWSIWLRDLIFFRNITMFFKHIFELRAFLELVCIWSYHHDLQY